MTINIVGVLFTLMMARGFYTSVRLLQQHFHQYGWANEETDLENRADDLDIVRGKLLLRALRLVIATFGLVVGVGGMFPSFSHTHIFEVLVILTIFGIAALLEFVNEYDWWQLKLGWPWKHRR